MENEKRLINANALKSAIIEYHANLKPRYLTKLVDVEIADVLDIVDEQPTVDAVEVVHGHWTALYKVDTWMGISTIDCFVCSECGKDNNRKGNYCPNCGAKMDGERKDNG